MSNTTLEGTPAVKLGQKPGYKAPSIHDVLRGVRTLDERPDLKHEYVELVINGTITQMTKRGARHKKYAGCRTGQIFSHPRRANNRGLFPRRLAGKVIMPRWLVMKHRPLREQLIARQQRFFDAAIDDLT